jgi:hypothetical protein
MRIKLNYVTPLLVAGAAAAAIGVAPMAAAASTPVSQSCSYVGGGFQNNVCQTPGNVQINDAPPPVQAAQASNPFTAYGPFFTYDRG